MTYWHVAQDYNEHAGQNSQDNLNDKQAGIAYIIVIYLEMLGKIILKNVFYCKASYRYWMVEKLEPSTHAIVCLF